MPEYEELTDAQGLHERAGQKVALTGRITTLQWARMSAFLPVHPCENLFDAGGTYLVVYTRTPIDAPGDVQVRGTVMKLEGAEGSKGAGHAEYPIVADEWVVLDR